MAARIYVMLKDSKVRPSVKANDLVYEFIIRPYGMADPALEPGAEDKVFVTSDPNGGVPFFTVPRSDIKQA